ncbi:MAG: hypothetical protein WD989_00955 [Candidatus Paceibacterota bacterium]
MIGGFFIDKINIVMDVEPNFEPQLAAARKKERIPTLNAPGLIWLLIVVFLVSLGLAVSLLGKQQNLNGTNPVLSDEPIPTITAQPRIYTVSYKNGVFSPTNLRIHAGDTVRFKNEALFAIRILSDSYLGFDSVGDIPQGSFFSFTFAAKGIFDYHNNSNAEEKGTIIVR